jgi:hypothetical protein
LFVHSFLPSLLSSLPPSVSSCSTEVWIQSFQLSLLGRQSITWTTPSALKSLTLKLLFYFCLYWGLNSGPCACLASALTLEPCPSPSFLVSNILIFFKHVLTFLPWLGSDHGPPISTFQVAGIISIEASLSNS